MGVSNSQIQQSFKPPIPQIQFKNKEIHWNQLSYLLSSEAKKQFTLMKQLYNESIVHWQGTIVLVLTNSIQIKMNPSIQQQFDIQIVFDSLQSTDIFRPLIHQSVDFVGKILDVGDIVQVQHLNVDIYSGRKLTPIQQGVVDQLSKSLKQINAQTLRSSPSWLEFLVDTAPNSYNLYFETLQNALVRIDCIQSKELRAADGQQFVITNQQKKLKNNQQYQILGQLQCCNDNDQIEVAQMLTKEVKQFEQVLLNKVFLSDDERARLFNYQNLGQSQKQMMNALLRHLGENEEIKLHKMQQGQTRNDILNKLLAGSGSEHSAEAKEQGMLFV